MASLTGKKVAMVLIDGLRDDVARETLGFMEGMAESGAALRVAAYSILPSLSRPCYATLFTGVEPSRHGITGNLAAMRVPAPTVFDALRSAGGVSVACAYHWMSELFCRAPFDPVMDVERNAEEDGISSGRFYFEDAFPDSHLFAQAERLRTAVDPDFLLVHPMGCDHAGHQYGAESREYRRAAAGIDHILAKVVPRWLEDGFDVVVTSDHGMDEYGMHGGNAEGQRRVPLYLSGAGVRRCSAGDGILPQTAMAGLLCKMLGVPPETGMAELPPFARTWIGLGEDLEDQGDPGVTEGWNSKGSVTVL